MTNEELQTAINRTHEMMRQWSYDSGNYKALEAHFLKLLHIQQVRASVILPVDEEEGTPC